MTSTRQGTATDKNASLHSRGGALRRLGRILRPLCLRFALLVGPLLVGPLLVGPLLVGPLLVGPLLVGSASAEVTAPPIPAPVAERMQNRQYIEAAAAIDEAVKDEQAARDYLGYLKGRALHLAGRYDEAAAAFDAMVAGHPDSPWTRRARFAKGLALARKGDYRAAELIYRKEAEYLFSLDRKQEVADIYLEFAQAYFNPKDEQKKPDYKKALEFYQKAHGVGPKPDQRIEIELKIAQCRQHLGQHQPAAASYRKLIKDYPDHPLQVEARFRLGEVELAANKLVQARRTWRDLLDLFKNSDSPRLAEAAFNVSLTYRLPKPTSDEELALGVAALESFLKRFGDHKLASVAHLRVAESYQHRGRHVEAVKALRAFLADPRYADREELPRGRQLLGESLRMQKKFDEALAAWREFLVKHPTDKAWSDVQKAIIGTEYLKAHAEYERKQYAAARRLWQEYLVKYPLDIRNKAILYNFGQMHFAEEKYDDAIADWRRLVSKYPGTPESSAGQFRIAETLETKLGKLEEALKEFRRLNWGGHAGRAQAQVKRLTAKGMRIETERVFRSDETPRLKLVTRNIENVTVRVYQLDLETYFRKMHLARGIEQLDIALIDPDRSFEFKVPEFKQYERRVSVVEIPPPAKAGGDQPAGNRAGGNVMAVTVSSKTTEATTLVVQSDLDVLVKSSRDEVFVFAENMRTGKPWADARILISDGKQVFAEGSTAADGVFRKSFEELKTCRDVRVFAIAGRHTAANIVGLNGIGVARGLTPKGYIYSDRPAYRPGQMVHVRGVLRNVVDDHYVVDKGKKYELSVFDHRNRLVFDQKVALNDVGSFHAHFQLPDASPQGAYRVHLEDERGQSFQGTFQVHDYRLQTVRLEVDTPRTVYYRGEEIQGTIRVSYYYGAPLVDREVRYVLANGRTHVARTNKQGEIPFTLSTREFRESQAVGLSVTLPGQNLTSGTVFQLATTGFSLAGSLARSTYLAGETFDFTVNARDAQNEPVQRDLELAVLRRTEVDGRIGEQEVARHELKSDDKGQARRTLRLDEGGQYLLRTSGTDRFGNEIISVTEVSISDDRDRVRLRILADKHHFKVGDVAKINLHWREQPALALVTFQGARILQYRLVPLATGANQLDVPMSSKLAPNFDLAVAVMTDLRNAAPLAEGKPKPLRLHAATSPFQVDRQLNVAVQVVSAADPNRAPRPGERVKLMVTTTDPQGKPVAAEVSLALVEKALLERFGAGIPAIQAVFRGAARQSAVRTSSSITFGYRPATKAINARLLAEGERLARERLEEDALAAVVDAVEFGAATRRPGNQPGGDRDGEFAGELNNAIDFVNPNDQSQLLVQPRQMIQQEAEADLFGYDGGQMQQQGAVQRGTVLLSDGQNNRKFSFWTGLDTHRGHYQSIDLGVRYEPQGGAVQWKAYRNAPEIPVLKRNGVWENLNFQRMDENETRRVLTGLAAEDARLLTNLRPHETAYWNPAVQTGDDGQAELTIDLPQRSTAWSVLAKGITAETLAGENREPLVVKKDLFGQLKLPAALTDGDEAEIVATVHNEAIKNGDVEVTLKFTLGDKTTSTTRKLTVNETGIRSLIFKQKIELPVAAKDAGGPVSRAELELIVASGDHRDVHVQSVPVQPYGMSVFALAGGSAQGDVSAFVEAPANMRLTAPRLQIIIGPTIEQALLDAVLAPPVWCQREANRVSSSLDSTTSDLLGALALQKLVGRTRNGSSHAAALDSRIRSAISLLVSLQNEDGGWNWAGRGGSNRYTTARVVWSLSLARKAGYRVEDGGFDKATTFLRGQLAKLRVTDYETKCVLLHAQSEAGTADFRLANQLYRNRQTLSPAGLAHVALALVNMDRKQTAGELLELLGQRKLDAAAPRLGDHLSWNQSAVELRAIYALALDGVAPGDARLASQIDWLLAHRTGHRWSPDKATGPALLALSRWYGRSRFQGEKYELTVFVNDQQAKKLTVDRDALTQTINVPATMLAKGKQRIRFQIAGRGRYTYQCVLGGFVAGDKLQSTTKDWAVTRHYEPAPRELDGREIPRGFDVVQGSYKSFRNSLSQLAVGQRGRVELRVNRHNLPSNTPTEQLEYLVITEPLPAGATVVEKSIKGGFERYEVQPGAITFYVGSRQYVTPISYEIHGYLAGSYRAAPTLVRNAYRPDQIAVAGPRSLTVLPLGTNSADAYRLTPRELFEFGKRSFESKDYAQAARHLGKLLNDWNLKPNFYQEAVRMLLDIHLEAGPPNQVVRYFEIIIEKYPNLQIPFAKLLQVGDAYHKIGEYERSYLVFRATVEASFMRESRVAGFLESQQEYLRSVDVMNKLLREYPPEAYVAAATYALAQRVYAKAPNAAKDAKLRDKKITRVDLIRSAWSRLESFLSAYPDDPAADEASFSLANSLLDLELYKETISHCREYAKRYPDSEFLDSYWYIIGFCHYALGQHPDALKMCAKVAEAKRKDQTTGRESDSPNKWRAIYILGQIHHSLGEAAKAIAEYERVKDRFVDARQAIDFFARKQIEIPEVSTFKPGEPAKVKLKFRNVASCETTVYRIDLMKYSLLRRSLGEVTKINLSGIRPYHQVRTQLGDGKDYRDRSTLLDLPLKEEGAYLIVCRGENLHASGLAVVSPLAAQIQEEPSSGRVRTTIRNVVDDRYVEKVHVKVIGSSNEDFVSGETDLRGIFVADGIRGTSMVIAQADNRYAFFRGEQHLGPPPEPGQSAPSAANAEASQDKAPQSGKAQLLDQLKQGNLEIQKEQRKQLDSLYRNSIDEGIGGGFGGGLLK